MKLGKIVALALAVALSPAAARAEGKIAIGPQGGLTFPNYNVKDSTVSSLYGNKNGWMAGFFAEFGVWAITLRPELNFASKGYTIGSITVQNHYLEVPVLVKINPLGEMPVSPFLVVGPQWSKQIGESVTAPAGTVFTNTVTNWDISGVAGLGLDINFSKNLALELQGRYNYGFRNVSSSAVKINERGFYVIGGLSIQDAF